MHATAQNAPEDLVDEDEEDGALAVHDPLRACAHRNKCKENGKARRQYE